MGRYLTVDAGIEESRTSNGSWSAWITVRDLDRGNMPPATYRAALWGNEDEDVMIGLMMPSKSRGPAEKDVEPVIRGFIQDLLSAFGEDGGEGRSFAPAGDDWKSRTDGFMKRMSERVFRDCLADHKVADRLSYEQALLVLQEFYVVDPIMTS